VSGTTSRNKGKRGEREACRVLEERDWTIIELGPGRKTEDVIATDPAGVTVSVEVKNHAIWTLTAWRRQAKEQARKRRCAWLLMCRVPDMPATFYVEGTERRPTVWVGR
jgi:Holliday junction resolvase